jgi:hypothetical protein
MKDDYLKECLTDIQGKLKKSVPIDQFSAEFCVYCLNNQCSRSGGNNSLFQIRAKNWYTDKFTEVQRAREDDPEYAGIRNKWYKPQPVVLESSPVEVKSTSPTADKKPQKDVPKASKATPKQKPAKKSAKPKKIPSKVKKSIENISVQEVASKTPIHVPPYDPKPLPSLEVKKPSMSGNTRWDQEEFIGEAPDKKESDIVISPGGTFTFGS